MFYEIQLLGRGGKFATIWIAANRGTRALTNADIRSLNILISCEEIMKYIISNSHSPSHRFSLSLSSKLIHGLCMIFRKHVDDVYNDTLKMMVHTPKTLLKPLPESEQSYDTPQGKPKKRVVKKRKEIHSDDPDLVALGLNMGDLLRTLEEEERKVPHPTAPETDITLTEIDERILLRQPQELDKQPDEHMDIGRFEDFQLIENLMAAQDKDAGSVIEKVRTPLEEVIQRPVIEKVPAAAPAITVQSVVEEVPEKEAGKPEGVKGKIFDVDSKRKPRKKKVNDNIFIKIVHRRKVAIDRPNEKENLRPHDSIHKDLQFLYNLDTTKTFFLEDETMDIQPTQKSPVGVRVETVESERELISVARSKTMGVSSLKSPSVESSRIRRRLSHHTAELEFVPVIKSTPIIDECPLMPPPPPSATPSLTATTPIRAPAETQLEKQIRRDLRLNEEQSVDGAEQLVKIIQQVETAQRRGEMPLTLEQVADKPLSKKTVASAFGKLLTLHAMGYVELISEENSSELSHINLGPKLM